MDQRLVRLQRIAGIMADRALAPVAVAAAEAARIEARIAEIAEHRRKLQAGAGDPATAGTMLAQAERLRVKQAAELSKLAAARVKLDVARRDAAKAVGRDKVLEKLVSKRTQAAEMKARRGG